MIRFARQFSQSAVSVSVSVLIAATYLSVACRLARQNNTRQIDIRKAKQSRCARSCWWHWSAVVIVVEIVDPNLATVTVRYW
jgi:hypothetical protein